MELVCDGAQIKGKGAGKTVFVSGQSVSTISAFKGATQGVPVNGRTDTVENGCVRIAEQSDLSRMQR